MATILQQKDTVSSNDEQKNESKITLKIKTLPRQNTNKVYLLRGPCFVYPCVERVCDHVGANVTTIITGSPARALSLRSPRP